ncbi:MAG TPA: helix-hairpin-helix domain-containing protein [Gemmatimonadaceae bacterium]
MSIQSEHKALIFCAVVAVLGVGVRALRAATSPAAPSVQPALDRQVQAADSAAQAGRGGKGKGKGKGKSKRNVQSASDSLQASSQVPAAPLSRGVPPARTGYIGNRLDLDVATAAQLDSLPGVTPRMAKRIVADRMMRGPFLSRDGLRRVSGVGPNFLAKIDSLIAFSGTFARPQVSDTVIVRPVKPRSKRLPSTPGGLY